MKQLEDSKFSKAIDILIGCSVRLGSRFWTADLI